MKDQLHAVMAKNVGRESEDNPFAALATSMASLVIDKALDALVTPAGVATASFCKAGSFNVSTLPAFGSMMAPKVRRRCPTPCAKGPRRSATWIRGKGRARYSAAAWRARRSSAFLSRSALITS